MQPALSQPGENFQPPSMSEIGQNVAENTEPVNIRPVIDSRKQVKELLETPFTAEPVSGAELNDLSNGELDPVNPTYDKNRLADKYGPEGPNALENRDKKRIFDLTREKVSLVETEDEKKVRYNFAVLTDGRVMIGKYYESDGDAGVKHFQLSNGADTKITGQIYVKDDQIFVNNNSATFRYMLFQNYRNYYQSSETGAFVTYEDKDNKDMLVNIFSNLLEANVLIGPDYIEEDVINDFLIRIGEKIARGEKLDASAREKFEFLKKWPNFSKAIHHSAEGRTPDFESSRN